MIVAFIFYAAMMAHENRMQPRDWAWLRQIQDVISNREERLPEVGRYNAGQKLVFWSVVLCLAGLLLTGIVIWRAYFSEYFPDHRDPLALVVARAVRFRTDWYNHRAHLCGNLGQRLSTRHDPRHRDTGLGMEASSRLVSREMTHAASSRSRSD